MRRNIFRYLFFAATLSASLPAFGQFLQQGPKLVGTGADTPASQGTSIALSADGNTAIVGGPFDGLVGTISTPINNKGAVWIFVRNAGVWTQQGPKLADSVFSPTGQGYAVAISADGNTALAGEPDADGITRFGRAIVWTRTAGVWSKQADLSGTGALAFGQQGRSVALSADGNTAVLGGPETTGSGPADHFGVGAAWVFTRSGGVWTQQGPKLVGTGAVGFSAQGLQVAVSGDGNTLVVAGQNDNSQKGAVWTFTRSGGVWTQQGAKLTISVPDPTPQFGASLALSTDGNTLLVGANGLMDGTVGFPGGAFVFTRSGGVWTQQGPQLLGSGRVGLSTNEGVSVALSGDGNTALVGGYLDNGQTGATWVFTRIGGVWTEQPSKLVGTGAVGAAAQGARVALSSDGLTALESGLLDDSAGTDLGGKGAVWPFTYVPAAPVVTTQPQDQIGCVGARFQVTFTAAASGSLVPVVQWQVSVAGGVFTDIPGATSTTLTFSMTPALAGNRYRAVFTNFSGTATTNAATLSLGAPPSITLDATPQTAVVGQTAVFTAVASGNPPPTVQWLVSTDSGANFNAVPGATSPTLNVTATPAVDGNLYAAGFSNTCGFALSSIVRLSVTSAPVITTQPSSQTICAGAGSPQFLQQNGKLVGTGAVPSSEQGASVSLSADGNTAIVGGPFDNTAAGGIGASWIYTRSGDAWIQQGPKLVGTGATVANHQGGVVAISGDGNTVLIAGNTGDRSVWFFTRGGGVWTQQGAKVANVGGDSVALSFDGNTALIGDTLAGPNGGTRVFTRTGGVWTQQGPVLLGTGGTGKQGNSVSLSADGNTALIGNSTDNSSTGAAWVFTRTAGVWTQQGGKLVGTGAVGAAAQATSVALSADGNTAVIGGPQDNNTAGAMWVFTQSGGVWTQQGGKLVGTGATGPFGAQQGFSVAVSGDGSKALSGGLFDGSAAALIGATWVFTRSAGVWTQQGPKLVGDGASALVNRQGRAVALSADGTTAMIGGLDDNNSVGAAWVFATGLTQFAAAATGMPTPTVQWQVSADGGTTFSNFPNATYPTLAVTPTSANDGRVYQAVFTTPAGTATSNKATLTVNSAPSVTLNPSDQSLSAGTTATFMASAAGKPSPSVQWQVSVSGGAFTDLPGATSATLSFPTTLAMNGNRYQAVFTDSCGTATTAAAALTVSVGSTRPEVTLNPSGQTACAGSTVSFTASAAATPTPTVQWQVSANGGPFANISGATFPTLSFSASAALDGNQYRAVFFTPAGSAISTAAPLTVNTPPFVTLNPLPLNLGVGDTAVFTAAASGKPAPTVQWQVSTNGGVSFANIPGATSTTLSFQVTQAMNGNRYLAVFTNTCGQAATDPPVALGVGAPSPTVESDGVYQIRYLANLDKGDSYVNLSNAGTLSGFDPAGRICVNAYTFDPAEEMISCCACPVTPNGLVSLSARNDLISNTLTPGIPTAVTVKLLSVLPQGGTCNPGNAPQSTQLARGMRAWATTLHLNTSSSPAPRYQSTETEFSKAELSPTEFSKLASFCGFIQANGSGFGICKSCRLGSLGANQR